MANITLTSRSFSFSGLAQAAARLKAIEPLASSLKLTSLNAQVLTARAGEEARGFDPLTHAITDLATTMTATVSDVTQVARKLSKDSITAYRLAEACRVVDVAARRAPDVLAAMLPLKNRVDEDLASFMRGVDADMRVLNRLMTRLSRLTRQATFMDASCRIEAAHVPSHQNEFNNVANYLKEVTQSVVVILDKSIRDLSGENEREAA